ncbi:MAG: HDOD domain-containing protein [Gammaproteobacteria bacterium]|nr:HDOD domain-containing protein [Gammaproteobacteria bacterium]
MPVANTIIRHLDDQKVTYRVLEVEPFADAADAALRAGIPPEQLLQSCLIGDSSGQLMVVIPANRELNLRGVQQLLRRPFKHLDDKSISQLFADCVPRFLPPLGAAYGIRCVLETQFAILEQCYMLAGDRRHLIQIDKKSFRQLFRKYEFAKRLSAEPDVAPSIKERLLTPPDPNSPLLDLKAKIERTKKLPAMPAMAQKIFQLRAKTTPGIKELSDAVELDPSLAAQVMRYASSPFFGYRGKVDSVNTAITRVLGYDMVMSLALGIATARPFRLPKGGATTVDDFWRHAVYSAALCQSISNLLPEVIRPPSGLAYLSGLLHNFGHVLLGHLFKDEYLILGKMMAQNPDTPIQEIELSTLGAHHGDIGAWLMKTWRLPEEVIVAIEQHHNEDYQGPHSVFSGIVLLADRMLKRHGMGDADSTELPETVLSYLDITEYQLTSALQTLMDHDDGLRAMAYQLAV